MNELSTQVIYALFPQVKHKVQKTRPTTWKQLKNKTPSKSAGEDGSHENLEQNEREFKRFTYLAIERDVNIR